MDKIIDSIAYEKGLDVAHVENSLKESLIQTAHKMIDQTLVFDATFNRDKKELKLFQKIEVIKNDDERLTATTIKGMEEDWETKQEIEVDLPNNTENFISEKEAKKLDSELEIGDFLNYDLEFESMGRNASSILFSNLEYKLQKYISDNLFEKYEKQVGTTLTSVVTSIDKQENTFVEIGEVRGILPRKNRIKGESFKVGDALKAVVRSVRIDKQHGLIVELSRTSPKFLEALLNLEVPELKDQKITIESCGRIPGVRAKIALSTIEPGIDPIGTIVGVKGVRINAVSEQLNGENIDCIEYTTVQEMFVARSLSPAIVQGVKIQKSTIEGEKDKAIVTLLSDQKARAIGKSGLNIRLASMLTKCDIELNEIEDTTPKSELNNQSNKRTENTKSKDTSVLEALFN
ncbi:Transcription termination protein NusA [hydrothermal vent metagenome]|uniref:Transcription termination protein NusA n=1 Tax=hydrothermal vent metagenome TaxID=652676 RepID=A0A3B1DYH3_9ZZZZ